MRTKEFQIGCARRDLTAAINAVQMKYELSNMLMDGVISSVLAELRSGVVAEMINGAEQEISDIIKSQRQNDD